MTATRVWFQSTRPKTKLTKLWLDVDSRTPKNPAAANTGKMPYLPWPVPPLHLLGRSDRWRPSAKMHAKLQRITAKTSEDKETKSKRLCQNLSTRSQVRCRASALIAVDCHSDLLPVKQRLEPFRPATELEVMQRGEWLRCPTSRGIHPQTLGEIGKWEMDSRMLQKRSLFIL